MKKKSFLIIFLTLFICSLFASPVVMAGNTRLHVTTDKESYKNAETVQFQVIMLNPSPDVNNSLFIELLDCNGNRISQQMLPFNFNISSGQIRLPELGKTDFYLLYCYVNNTDSLECSSVKKLFIKNDNKLPARTGEGNIRISSFYEGGTFVAESPNNILVQCLDDNGRPVVAKGKITDGKAAVYAVFETNELGFAKVLMNPENNMQYFVEVQSSPEKQGRARIRLAAPSGITLNTALNENSITYSLVSYTGANDKIPLYRIEALYLDSVIYEAAISFQNGLSAVKEEISRMGMPAGFIRFRLIDQTNKLYAQRVIYNPGISPKNNFITVIDTVNKKEARIILPELVSGKASVQIKTADSLPALNNEPRFLEVTDRFSINDQLIAGEMEPGSFPGINNNTNRYLSITGLLQNPERKPLKNRNVNIILVHKDLRKQYLVAKTDNEGWLRINNLVFFDTVTVYYQLADKSEGKNNVLLELNVSPSPAYPAHSLHAADQFCGPVANKADSIRTLPDEKELKQVTVSANREKTESEKFEDKYVSGQMKRTQGTRNEFDFIRNPEEIDNRSLFDFLKGRMAGIKIFDNPDGTPAIRGTNGGTVGVYLNDMEIPEANFSLLANMLIRDMALIKYYNISLRPKTGLRNELTDIRGGDGGDLLLYTRQDFSSAEEKTRGLPKTTAVGYYEPKTNPDNYPNDQTIFWTAGCDVVGDKKVYMQIPAGAYEKNIMITLEGINAFLMPYHFTQKLVFK